MHYLRHRWLPAEVDRSSDALVVRIDVVSHSGRFLGWRPESGVKGTGAVPASWVRLGDGTDILRDVSVLILGYFACPELAGRVEQGAAQVLQQAQSVGGHGQAAPAAV
jgi:hypothetical protein